MTEPKVKNSETIDELFRVLATLHGEDEFRIFFADMCTDKEIEHMAERIRGAKLLIEGETYVSIISKTDLSAATLSRVSRCVQYGSGGYRDLLQRYLIQNGKEEE